MKLKAGLVGLHFGAQIIDSIFRSGEGGEILDLVSVCDLQRERCDEIAKKHSVRAVYDLDTLLADESLQVILLFTGPVGRAELIRKCIRAGKHVMTTKPFEQNSEAAASVLAEARRLNRVVYLNSPGPRPSEDLRIIRGWENTYDLGRLVGAHHECWYKSVEEADGSWYDDPERCPAPPILRLGIYGINDLVQFFSDPEEIQVQQSRIFTGRPTSDFARLSIKFRDGSLVDSLTGWVCQPGRAAQSLTLYYENGTVFRNPVLHPEIMHGGGAGTYLCVVTKDSPDSMPEEQFRLRADQLGSRYDFRAFHHAITTGKRPEDETADEIIVSAVKILEGVKAAVKQGGVVQL